MWQGTKQKATKAFRAFRGLSGVSWFKPASLVHGSGWQELESVLDFGRLGVEERGKKLEVAGRIGGCVFHGWGWGCLGVA